MFNMEITLAVVGHAGSSYQGSTCEVSIIHRAPLSSPISSEGHLSRPATHIFVSVRRRLMEFGEESHAKEGICNTG